jgi:HK97 family phage portal protein
MKFWKRTKQIITKAVPIGLAPDWLTDRAFWSPWDAEAAMREGYKSVAWVYAAVKLRANAVASVPLKVELNQGGEWVETTTHPLARLLNSPNTDLDKNEMMRILVTHLDLAGNGYWLKTRAGNGMPVELWPMLPQFVRVVPGRERLIRAYEYTQHGVQTYPADDMMHAAYTNPENLYYGLSPLQAAGKAVDIDNAAASWQKVSMQNRGVPDGIFSFDADMTYDQWQEARAMVREEYTGMGSNRAPWVLSKAKYQQLAMSPVEMDYMETRKHSMQQICAVYGVPTEMINGLGDANRASSETVRKSFWIDTVTPLLIELEGSLNIGLARDFGTADQIRIRFDTSSVPALQENYTEKVTNAKALWSMGVPFNAINEKLELGFDEIEGGQTGYIPSGVIPASIDFDSMPANASEAYGEPSS